jgi:hypothetical protein
MTKSAKDLLAQFRDRIQQTDPEGKITTWEESSAGLFTHKAAQWANKAWFKAAIVEDRLRFNIIRPEGKNISVTTYGYYHGHLIETFLNHFDNQFTQGGASAKPTTNDDVTGA